MKTSPHFPSISTPEGTVFNGNSLEILKEIPANSVDAVITDPPYEIGIAGNEWDRTGIAYNVELWAECLRVLKPGGHIVSFATSKNYHRVAVAIEDAGFEVREMFTWIYSGFSKGISVSKAIDSFILAGAEYGISRHREEELKFTTWLKSTGITTKEINSLLGGHMGSHYLTQGEQPAIPKADKWERIKTLLAVEIPDEIEELVKNHHEITYRPEKEHTPEQSGFKLNRGRGEAVKATTPEGQQWEQWKTVIKSQQEPAVVARKPIEKGHTLAQNVLKYGTGAINMAPTKEATGKEPGTVIVTGKDELERYFYHAKANKHERPVAADGFQHATVKPLTLMEFIITALTQEGATVLDPFAGSGTTLEAAQYTGRRFIGIDITAPNMELIEQRLNRTDPRKK